MKPTANQIICGNNIDVVKPWPANCIDGLVTDPPYGLGFMGKDWDTFKQENVNLPKTTKLTYKTDYINGIPVKRNKPEIVTRDSGARRAGSYDLSRNSEFQQWFTVWAKAMLRITKPGGFLLCFGGTRTYHRLACAIEDAGWEIRDCMMWLYGSGFPKSHNISKAIDKAAGAKRQVIGIKDLKRGGPIARQTTETSITGWNKPDYPDKVDITIPATDLAQLWDGYGTALKPAWEPIIVAMKPLDGTFAHNAEAHGVAGLNIDAARIGTGDRRMCGTTDKSGETSYVLGAREETRTNQGRWPANLILDEEAGAMLDKQSGERKGWAGQFHNEFNPYGGNALQKSKTTRKGQHQGYKDSGGASRFFKQIKGDNKCVNVNTVAENSNLQEQVEDSVLSLAVIEDSQEDKPLKSILAPFMNEIRTALKTNSTKNITQTKHLGRKCLQELKHMSMEQLTRNPVNNVEILLLINTMTIIQSLLNIDGFVEVAMSSSTLCNMVLGEKVLRFKYSAKTSRKERNIGMKDCEDKLLARSGGAQGAENRGEKEYLQKHIGLNRVAVVKNNHPTVKPLALMKYLCTLLKMPSADQIILDPFLGSGTTAMACASLGIGFIGIEKELEYCEISAKRIATISGKTLPVTKNVETFRAATSFVSGGGRPNENSPHVSEHRQSIINAAVAALRRNRK